MEKKIMKNCGRNENKERLKDKWKKERMSKKIKVRIIECLYLVSESCGCETGLIARK